MFPLPSLKLSIIVFGGVVAIAGLLFAGGYQKGRSDGRISQLKDTVQAHENRKVIDQTVGGLNGYDLCRQLGGLPDECAELRGVE